MLLSLPNCYESEGPGPNGIAPLADYLVLYQCRLRRFALNADAYGTGLSHILRLITPSMSTLQEFSCDNFVSLFNHISDLHLSDQLIMEIFKFEQYTSLTTFKAVLSLEFSGLDEQKQYIRFFSQILCSGKPTRNSSGLRYIFITAEFPSGDPHDISFWGPIVESLSSISTLEEVCFRLRLWGSFRGRFAIEAQDPDMKAKAECSMYYAWKQVLEDALNAAGLTEKSQVTLDLGFLG
ncbi:hypothetical protein DL96DRAFT_555787 [Flagelloscypha sp. PMI_526]|nr:hypothetical protein DL96DRAFT_555787 [Flagelloscypha sp. PMI_526]